MTAKGFEIVQTEMASRLGETKKQHKELLERCELISLERV